MLLYQNMGFVHIFRARLTNMHAVRAIMSEDSWTMHLR